MTDFTGSVNHLPCGEYVEVGVWEGDGAALIASWMLPDSTLYLMDSFEGHAEPCQFDNAKSHYKGRYKETSIELVRSKVPQAVILKGYVPDTFPLIDGLKFRYVKIDVDHYLPTKAACEFFKKRMVSGGVIEFDDYQCPDCPGATKAIEETFPINEIRQPAPHWIAP